MLKRLSLRRETLTPLTTEEMAALAGGRPTDPQPTPPQYVVTYTCTRSVFVCTIECMSNDSCHC